MLPPATKNRFLMPLCCCLLYFSIQLILISHGTPASCGLLFWKERGRHHQMPLHYTNRQSPPTSSTSSLCTSFATTGSSEPIPVNCGGITTASHRQAADVRAQAALRRLLSEQDSILEEALLPSPVVVTTTTVFSQAATSRRDRPCAAELRQ